MTVSEFCGKVHLPSVVAHFGVETPRLYRKVPTHGWYAQSKDMAQTFNCVDLFKQYNHDNRKDDPCGLIANCYRYYTIEHPELLEVPIKYSETTEERLMNSHTWTYTQNRLYQICRQEAEEGYAYYRGKKYKFTKLLEEFGMPCFLDAGIGLFNQRIANLKELDVLKLWGKYDKYSLLIPSFFAPNRCIASMDVAVLGDMSQIRAIYREGEVGWYGTNNNTIVGKLADLMTVQGSTWHPWLCSWLNNQSVTLHHSLQPDQCVDIWANLENIKVDRNPLGLIKRNEFEQVIKHNLGKLNITQLEELEKLTGSKLQEDWIAARTTETSVGGIKFLNNKGRYYYIRNNLPIEFANFAVELIRIRKEDGEFYQHGVITMGNTTSKFRVKRRHFVSYQMLIAALTDVLLEAGMGVPVIAPNLKHYLVNVIEAFSPMNIVEKPTPAPEIKTEQDERILTVQ